MPVLIKDIAAKANVSVATVSRVVNNSGYVNPETRRKVLEAMKALNYRPNLVARSLVTKQSNTIGLMIPHIDSPFFAGFASAVEERADELGYNVILCDTREDIVREEKCLDILINRQVDGIIVTPVGKENKHLAAIAEYIPVVFAARKIDGISISSVTVDNNAGSYRVIEHLLKIGHNNIAVINGPMFLSSGRERWLGVKRAFEDNNIAINGPLVREGDFTAPTGYLLAKDILASGVNATAFYGANHLTTIGILRALHESGLRIPGDVAVASFEGLDDTVFDYLIWPKLTANIHPTKEMGNSSVNLLVEQIQNIKSGKGYISKDIILNTKLKIAGSTVPKD